MGGVEYQVTKVDPTDPHTKGAVYQVHKVSEEIAATLGGKVYRARIINDPTEPTVAGKVYQIVLIDDPDDPAVKGKVYNAILTGGSEAVVVGPAVSPLALPDAVAGDLDYVKAYGGTEQNNLPIGYTLLDYIESAGTQYIDLGIKGNGTTKAEVKFKYYTATSASGSGRVFGSRNAAAVDAFAIGSASGTASTSSTIAFFFGNQSYLVTDKSVVLDEWLDVIFDKTTHNINGTDYGDPYNDETFETPQTLKLFGFDNNGTMGYGQVDVAYCKVWDNGVLIRDLVPCKNASNVIGMYDLVNDVFYQNAGTDNFVAGPDIVPTPTAPIDLVCNNGVLKFTANEANYTADNVVLGYWLRNSDGQPETSPANFYTAMMSVKPNTSYVCFGRNKETDAISGYNRIAWYDADGVWIRNSTYTQNQPGIDTSPANAAFARFHCNINSTPVTQELVDSYNWVFQQGTAEVPYTPYSPTKVYADGTVETIEDTIGNTATAEMLLKVGDYKDVQEIISGAITRNVGVMALDGTEGWQLATATDLVQFYTSSTQGVIANNVSLTSTIAPYGCTVANRTQYDFGCYSGNSGNLCFQMKGSATLTTATAWAQWLVAQYNAGTPVIVVYPLATPTAESVAGQTLQVQDGDNTLEITQASIDGLELEAEYEKEAA